MLVDHGREPAGSAERPRAWCATSRCPARSSQCRPGAYTGRTAGRSLLHRRVRLVPQDARAIAERASSSDENEAGRPPASSVAVPIGDGTVQQTLGATTRDHRCVSGLAVRGGFFARTHARSVRPRVGRRRHVRTARRPAARRCWTGSRRSAAATARAPPRAHGAPRAETCARVGRRTRPSRPRSC